MIFFSTSRVYPIAPLRDLPLERRGDRFCIPAGRSGPGWSERGIRTEFPLAGARSLYGTTKLCSELLVQEYAETYGLTTVINRCGVVSGPWQMARLTVRRYSVPPFSARSPWSPRIGPLTCRP